MACGNLVPLPKPPFTPGYELVGIVEECGPGCTRLRVGDRIGALTVWGADAERVCVPESGAVDVPADLERKDVPKLIETLRKQMKAHAAALQFEEAAELRDRIRALETWTMELPA